MKYLSTLPRIAGLLLMLTCVWLVTEAALTVRQLRKSTILTDTIRIVARAQSTSELLLNCKGNPACLPSQLLATLGAIKATSGQLAVASRTVPAIAKSAESVASSIERSAVQIESTQQNLDATLSKVDTHLHTLSSVGVESLRAYGDTARQSTELIRDTQWTVQQMKPWVDCGSPDLGMGKDCLQRHIWMNMLKMDNVLSEVAIATPKVTSSIERTADGLDRTASGMATVATNFAEVTKPLSRKWRYVGLGLALAPPVVGIAAPLMLNNTLTKGLFK